MSGYSNNHAIAYLHALDLRPDGFDDADSAMTKYCRRGAPPVPQNLGSNRVAALAGRRADHHLPRLEGKELKFLYGNSAAMLHKGPEPSAGHSARLLRRSAVHLGCHESCARRSRAAFEKTTAGAPVHFQILSCFHVTPCFDSVPFQKPRSRIELVRSDQVV
jgi:hypothetical protein